MSLPHALLGLINYKPATGYDLKGRFDQSVHFFWNSTLPQIYRTLNDMKAKGWLKSTIEHQDGKPSRKVYSITQTGKEELIRWLSEPHEMTEPRDPLMIKVFFGNQAGMGRLVEHIKEWREYYASMVEMYEEEVTPLIDHYGAVVGSPGDAACWKLTLDFGKRQARMGLEWCIQALRDLEAARKK